MSILLKFAASDSRNLELTAGEAELLQLPYDPVNQVWSGASGLDGSALALRVVASGAHSLSGTTGEANDYDEDDTET